MRRDYLSYYTHILNNKWHLKQEDLQDTIQEAITRLIKNGVTLNDSTILKTANNIIIDNWRKQGKYKLINIECTSEVADMKNDIIRSAKTEQALNKLNDAILQEVGDRAKYIVTRKLNGASFNTIGKELGISRQRAQQIYKKAVDKIKSSSNIRMLSKDFVDCLNNDSEGNLLWKMQ